jgi:cell wall-associated NlpC family hydrolase
MRRTLVLVCALAGIFSAPLALTPARAQSTAALLSDFRAAGNRLDRASEAYNKARLERQRLDGKLADARVNVAHAEKKLAKVRGRLGQAVAYMYKHPAGGMDTFYQARSFGELERGSAFAGRVVLSTDDVLLQLRKARAEERGAMSTLQGLRDQARSKELEIAAERRNAKAAFDHTQSLLHDRQVADAVEADRIAGLAHAGSIARYAIHYNGPISPGARIAVATAAAQIGKPYQWGAAGPDRFDCSGLTMYSWAHAGVSMGHYTGSQWAEFPHVPLSELAPGDLVFFGSDIHHVGIYEGGGVMIHAPQTGDFVKRTSIWGMGTAPAGAVRP